jgi:hypothetical protein
LVVAGNVANHGRELLENLISAEQEFGASEVDAVSRAMALVERIAETDEPMAAHLMAALYEHASRLCLYELCDAIDIWMHQFRHPETARYIQIAASAFALENMVGKCEQWLKAITKHSSTSS